MRARLGEKRNWRESDDLDPLFPGPFSRDFYRTLSRTVHAEFRTRRALRALRAMAAAPLTDGRTAMSAGLAALGGLAELPIWLAGQARLLPRALSARRL